MGAFVIRNASSNQAKLWLKRGQAKRLYPQREIIVPQVQKAKTKRTVIEREKGIVEKFTL